MSNPLMPIRSDAQIKKASEVNTLVTALWQMLSEINNNYMQEAMLKLQECVMWADKAIVSYEFPIEEKKENNDAAEERLITKSDK